MITSRRTTNILLVFMLAVGIGIVALLATDVRGGSLDPDDPPASTMRSLDELRGAWNIQLPANDGPDECHSSRFLCVFENSAVLDRETNLVWERVVATNANPFGNARLFCMSSFTGNRMGWRLPTTSELTSLIDPGASAAPYLPAGHPFENVQAAEPYWTGTLQVNIFDERRREAVWFDLSLGDLPESGEIARYWCVRGGEGQLD